MIAAVTAQIRQRQQLLAESERLTKQLDAEGARLGMRFVHERASRDLAELRTVLDEGAVAIRRMMWAHQAIVQFLSTRAGYVTTPQQRSAAKKEIARLSGNAHDSVKDAVVIGERIALRLGREHGVYGTFSTAMDAFIRMLRKSEPVFEHPWRWSLQPAPRQQDLERIFEEGEEAFRQGHHNYVAAAEKVAGSRLDEPSA